MTIQAVEPSRNNPQSPANDINIAYSRYDWQAKIAHHQTLLNPIIEPHLKRSFKAQKHPIVDFLFDYYHFRAARLMQWSPGINVCLEDIEAEKFSSLKDHISGSQLLIDCDNFPQKRLIGLEKNIQLLEATLHRTPHFGCFGLHEWAMIYDQRDIRHAQLKLRFDHPTIKKIVESHRISCSHFDAFRFFSKSACAFNKQCLSHDNRHEHEQAACLHANMDLYRWSYSYYPWVDSDLIRDCFLLAYDIRHVDMRASPYDVSDYGLQAIAIETEAGKKQYIEYQQQFMEQAQKLRVTLLRQLKKIKVEIDEKHQYTIKRDTSC